MNEKKRIALIAHDNMKDEMLEWARENVETLKKHELCGTGTTSQILNSRLDLNIEELISGPFGGDLQVGTRVSEGKLDMVIFFFDPLTSQPHDPDIKALLRVAVLYDIPIATNRSTAEFLMKSEYMNKKFERNSLDMEQLKSKRQREFSHLK